MRDIITKDLGDLSTQDKEALKHVRPANNGSLDPRLMVRRQAGHSSSTRRSVSVRCGNKPYADGVIVRNTQGELCSDEEGE